MNTIYLPLSGGWGKGIIKFNMPMEYSMTVRALDSLLKIHSLGLNMDNLAGKEMLILQDT